MRCRATRFDLISECLRTVGGSGLATFANPHVHLRVLVGVESTGPGEELNNCQRLLNWRFALQEPGDVEDLRSQVARKPMNAELLQHTWLLPCRSDCRIS
jgi:hypothetical protein